MVDGKIKSLKRAILFDLDGVIIDSMRCHSWTWAQAIREKLGIDISENYFLVNEGRNAKNLLMEIWQTHQVKLDKKQWQSVSDYRDEIFLSSFSPRLVPGALELVQQLSEFGYDLGVATGSTRQVANEVLCQTGIRQFFSQLVTSEDVHKSKPDPEPYELLLQRLEQHPKNALVIENAPLGIQSALAANLICLAVATTNEPEILSNATFVFNNLDEIRKYLNQDYGHNGGVGPWSFRLIMEEHASQTGS